jgi:hypothetical protein
MATVPHCRRGWRGGALGIEYRENIEGEFGDSPFLAVASGFAVPGEIESDHAVIVREGGVLAIPEGTIGQPVVNEDDGGIRRAGYRVRYGNAVNRTRSSMEHGFFPIVGLGIPQRKEAACGSCFQEWITTKLLARGTADQVGRRK